MRSAMRPAAVLAVAATMFLVGMIVASAGSGSSGGGSTGPSTDAPGGRAAPQAVPLTTNTNPVPTFTPVPQSQVFVPIAPCRIVNTIAAHTRLAANTTHTFTVGGTTGFTAQGGNSTGCGIPLAATAISAYVTSQLPAAAGYIRAWPSAIATEPNATVLNFPKGGNVTVGATLSITPGIAASLKVRNHNSATDLLIDVTGYYEPQMHLIVLSDGTVWYGNNAHLTSVIHTAGTGSYTLVFDRSLAGCNVLTTSNDQRDVQAIGSWGGSSLTVATSHEMGGVFTQVDESFQVFVVC